MASFTKFAILKVFGDLAASRPVDKITVKDITDQCGISRNTFYYHYQDIYQVLKAYVQYSAEHVIELMVEDEGEDGKAGLKEIRYLEANRAICIALLPTRRSETACSLPARLFLTASLKAYLREWRYRQRIKRYSVRCASIRFGGS
mgnify:CR=1 FL=1